MKRLIPIAKTLLIALFIVVPFHASQSQTGDPPSIAILPFANLSGDADQDYLSAISTDNTAKILSKSHDLLVIRGSEPGAKTIKEVADELKVQYILQGSVQKNGDQLKLTATLSDAPNDKTLWSQEYDRPLTEMFDIHDAITQYVFGELDIKPDPVDEQRIWHRATNSIDAYRDYLRALSLLRKFNKEDMAAAQEIATKAVKTDPSFAYALVTLGYTHGLQGRNQWVEDVDAAYAKAAEYAEQAMASDPSYSGGFGLIGTLQRWQGNHDKSIEFTEKAVALNPNDATTAALLAVSLTFKPGRYEDGLKLVNRALRLDPAGPAWYTGVRGWTHYVLGEYDKAIDDFKYVAERQKTAEDFATLAMAYATVDRLDEAKAAVAESLKIDPAFTIKNMGLEREPDEAIREKQRNALIKAGLPE